MPDVSAIVRNQFTFCFSIGVSVDRVYAVVLWRVDIKGKDETAGRSTLNSRMKGLWRCIVQNSF